jgi:hypothetical protein
MLDQLITSHPLLFGGRPPFFASALPEGWYEIADAVCEQLETRLTPLQLSLLAVARIRAVGGQLDFTLMGIYSESVHVMLNRAARLSATTCQECGSQPALYRGNAVNLTLCGFCEHERCLRYGRERRTG